MTSVVQMHPQSHPTSPRARGGEGAGSGSRRGCRERRERVKGARATAAPKHVDLGSLRNHPRSRKSNPEDRQMPRLNQVARSILSETEALRTKMRTQQPTAGQRMCTQTCRSKWRAQRRAERHRTRGRETARGHMRDQQRLTKKTISATKRTSLTYLEHLQSHLHHSPAQTSPPDHRMNP
jgi:hypothetical protein